MSADSARLLERDEHVKTLGDILWRAMDGSGRVVVVSGEAGIGKTSLLRKFLSEQQSTNSVYWGSCDALYTPRPLGPLQDIAVRLDSELARQLQSSSETGGIFPRLLAVLEAHEQFPILVFEDVHWADTATLDLIKFLGRRIISIRALLLLSFRSDEITRDHPLSLALGDIPPTSLRRVEIGPLSIDGVRQLVGTTSLDPEHLHRTTGGNPLFVSELISNESDGRALPASIRDSLRSRRARIGKTAQTVLDAVSIFPSPPSDWLLTHVLRRTKMHGCDECVAAGLLVRGENGELRFRHELARLAVLGDVPEQSRKELHASAVTALEAARVAGHAVQNSNIFHHAVAAGDGREVLRLAPLAAADAARVGAHAQAAEHLSTALRYIDLATPEESAQLYESWSYEAALAVKMDETIIEARHQAIKRWRAIGRQDKVGVNLRWLARIHWYRGEAKEAEKYLSEALAILEGLPPGPELAMAYAIRSWMLMLRRRTEESVDWGNRAIALARSCDALDTLVHALNTVGTAKFYAGQEAGLSMLEESLALSLQHELHEQAARAYANITSCAVSLKNFALAETYSARGIRFDSEHDLAVVTSYLIGYQSQMRLEQGRLTEARDIAESVLHRQNATRLVRMPAMLVSASARFRLGDDIDFSRLEQALADATAIGELQYLAPAHLALIEASWLRRDVELCRQHILALSQLPLDRLNAWNSGDVSVWFHRSGMSTVYQGTMKALLPPRQLEIEGRHAEAADALLELGMVYDAAMALTHARGKNAAASMARALQLFEDIGARAGVEFVRRRAADLGLLEQMPAPKRGPYAKSRGHPLGLTGREVQILKCVKDGLSNREISHTLHRSERTVEHHITAVLGKLGARNRIEALIRVQTEPWLLGSSGE